MDFAKVLRHLHSQSPSLKEQGTRFKKLIRPWIPSDPLLASEIASVWLWDDFLAKDQLGDKAPHHRKDAITDWILSNVRGRFGNARSITKETIFYYVYGILHSPEYCARFNEDLKKELPHIPIMDKVVEFIDFAEGGRLLGDMHCDYENASP